MTGDIESFIEGIKRRKDIRDVVYHRTIEPSPPAFSELKDGLDPLLVDILEKQGIERLYTHQCEAIELVRGGKNVVVMTPTASGKTLVYNIPVVESILKDSSTHALYIFPLKGLEQDQLSLLEGFQEMLSFENLCAIYDGDTPGYRRKKIRSSPPNIVLTNPDMLHLAILPFHDRWEAFFRGLRYVVIDEIHTYRGVLGSHMAQIMRRLQRVCRFYGSSPMFIHLSATIANPVELSRMLTGLPFTLVHRSGAPQGRRDFLFIDPPMDTSPYTLTVRIFTEALNRGLRTIVFTKTRRVTELIYRWLRESAPHLSEHVSAYRAGFLPEERRLVEGALFDGTLRGVVTTSALELGVDIGGLDVCILTGYPGTISATWQRSGRAGRAGRPSLTVLMALEDALDKYFMRHPAEFFEKSVEAAVLDRANHPILKAHLLCTVAERPVAEGEEFLSEPASRDVLEELKEEGRLWYSRLKKTWNPKRRYPHRDVSIRGTGRPYTIVLEDGTLIGESSGGRLLRELHPQAVYMHRGVQYLVLRVDDARGEVICREAALDYYTTPITEEDTSIISKEEKRELNSLTMNHGSLAVTEYLLGYRKKHIHTGRLLGEFPLSMRPVRFDTKGLWFTLDERIIEEILRCGYSVPGGLHAMEHSLMATLSLFAMCDRRDLGGVSYPLNPELEEPAIFIYDGYEGGVGLTKRGFEVAERWFAFTRRLLEDCPCELACPACTQDPQCGNNNEPLDKRSAIVILNGLLGV